jgi:hypothetical protein
MQFGLSFVALLEIYAVGGEKLGTKSHRAWHRVTWHRVTTSNFFPNKY